MVNHFAVAIEGRAFGPLEQTPDNIHWTESLARAHQCDASFCQCNPATPIKLVVKRYGAGLPTVRYGLARWPGTGLDHHIDCLYFCEDEVEVSEVLSPFDDLADGTVRAHLEIPLTRTVEKGKAADFARSLKPQARKTTEEKTMRLRATEQMLLQKLWRLARLNIFSNKARTWFHASFALIAAAKKIIINRQGETLADYLFVLSTSFDKLANKHNEAVLSHVHATQSRMYVIGRLKGYKSEKPQTLLPMMDNFTMPKTLASVSLLDECIGQSNFRRNILQSGRGCIVGLATIEPAGTAWWKTVSLVVLTTSNNMIPVCSSAELDFESFLCAAGRTFIKPIRIAEIAQQSTEIPEFILLDTAERVRCQIWGAKNECSLDEKARANSVAEGKGSAIVVWSANPREPFPDLPDSGSH